MSRLAANGPQPDPGAGKSLLLALAVHVAFFAFLKSYIIQMGHQRATADDWFRILRETTSTDISDIQSKIISSIRIRIHKQNIGIGLGTGVAMVE